MSPKYNANMFIENYYQNNFVDNKTKNLITQLINYLNSNDYTNYYEIFKQIPKEIINYGKNPNSYLQGEFPHTLSLVIENGTNEEFRKLFREPELRYNVHELITDCAFYGRLLILETIVNSGIQVDRLIYSNALFISLSNSHYDVADYLLTKNINNILAYDYILKNKEYSKECQDLFERYGGSMIGYNKKCQEAGKLLY